MWIAIQQGIYVASPFDSAQHSTGGNTIARYNVLYFCTACRRIHPMGVSLPLEVGFLNTKTVSEAYSGKRLPSYVAMLVGSSVTCRETGQSFVLEDINQLYLTPVLESLSRDSKRV